LAIPFKEVVAVMKQQAYENDIASYADFVIASFLYHVRRIDQEDYDRMVKVDCVLAELFAACEPWFERDD
jgi:hypothetical protein